MYPLFQPVVAPTLRAAGAKRVVEIGALKGDTTLKLLEFLGDEAELHVIDPEPRFDPTEHERSFPGRYHFHRATSHEVLPGLGAMDAALIDGDHNWYTVHGELEMLAAAARAADRPLPLLFLHDVGWPYGRRDLYYAPERIPEDQRQPYARRGIPLPATGRTELLEHGGFADGLCNALAEGGPRNGVLTALEDFVAEHDRPVRVQIVPIYFGLAVAAEEERLAARPELARALERLETPAFTREMLELCERLRVKEVRWAQGVLERWRESLDRHGISQPLERNRAAGPGGGT